jgi:putative ABC transport system permease protein
VTDVFRTTVRNLAARKVRLLSTGLAVVLGVAFMAGTLVLTDTLRHTFDTLFANANSGVDAYVRSRTVTGKGSMNEQRSRIDAALVGSISSLHGVAAAEAYVQGFTQIIGSDGQPVGGAGMGSPAIAGNWIRAPRLNPFTLVDGTAPAAPDEIVIDRGTATHGRLRVGDHTTAITPAGVVGVHVVGISRFGDTDAPGGASYVHFDLATAEQLLSTPGKIDAIRVAAERGVSEPDLTRRVAAIAPGDVQVLTGAQITAEDQSSTAKDLDFFNTFLMTFAIISLFVGSFIVWNSFSITVAQRSRETALLRAIGASRRQVLASIVGEAVAVGLIASVAGLAGGIGVAALLKALLGAMGIDLPAGGIVVSASTITISVVSGVVVTTVSALAPARRASKVAPVAALRDSPEETPSSGRRRLPAGAALGAVGVAALLVGLVGHGGVASVGAGVATIFIAVTVLGPTLAGPITRIIGMPVARWRGIAGGLARQNAMRNPRRTSATASALMIGIGLVAAISVFASSAKASIDRSLRAGFAGDLAVQPGNMGAVGLDPHLEADIAATGKAATVSPVRTATVDIDGSTHDVVAIGPATIGGVLDLGSIDGRIGDLGTDQVAIAGRVARAEGLRLGDHLAIHFADHETRPMTVTAIYDNADLIGDYVLGLPAYDANVSHRLDARILVKAADGVSVAELRKAVAHVLAAYPQATVQDADEYVAKAGAGIDRMLNLVYALLLLAIVIALIGIANTLALSVLERTRELGLLRAVGMLRGQLRATVRWESVLVAVLGAVTGLVVGTGFGWALVGALASQGIDTLAIPVGQLATITVLAALAGVVAAILPSAKAARLDILRAIAAP